MTRTLRGWLSNALDRVFLGIAEPIAWVVAAGLAAFALWRHRRQPWSLEHFAAFVAGSAWLIAALGITIFPTAGHSDLSFQERFEVQSMIPLADTIESFGNMRDRTMTEEEQAEQSAKIAADLEIPLEEVNLDPRIRGIDISTALRDPLGNLLLFTPFGLLAPAALGLRRWRTVALGALSISGAIELSQLFFGFGSLASVDDLIFNTSGAVLGFGLIRLATVKAKGSARRTA